MYSFQRFFFEVLLEIQKKIFAAGSESEINNHKIPQAFEDRWRNLEAEKYELKKRQKRKDFKNEVNIFTALIFLGLF